MEGETLPDQIASRLKRDILRGRLPPGTPVKERDHAAELGVSRTPMREAIRVLAKEGLVNLRPARSPIVAQPSVKQVCDSLDVLTAMELLSGDLACASAGHDDIEKVAALQKRMEEEAPHIDEIDLFELDMEFHKAIVAASGNEVLADFHKRLLERLWRARFLGSRLGRDQVRIFRQHNAIIDGLKIGDAAAVRGQVTAHLAILKTQIIAFMTRESGDPAIQGAAGAKPEETSRSEPAMDAGPDTSKGA